MEDNKKFPSFTDETWERIRRSRGFTPRELQVIRPLCEEVLSTGSLAERLGIKKGTIKTHIKNIKTKMRVKTVLSAALQIVKQAVDIEFDHKQEQG